MTATWRRKKYKEGEDLSAYYMDQLHLMADGHRVIADHLMDWLIQKGLVSDAMPSPSPSREK